jgi:hypothetical protein
MADSLSFAPTIKVFPCPNCRETINTSMQQCTFCGAPIDHAAAEASAEFTSRISAAVSDASYLSVLGWALLSFFLLVFVPLLGIIGGVGLIVLRVAIPIMVIRWWFCYGKLKSSDPDLKQGRKRAIVVTVVAILLTSDTAYNFLHRNPPRTRPQNIEVPTTVPATNN